jgi:flavin-binding protein dodecin
LTKHNFYGIIVDMDNNFDNPFDNPSDDEFRRDDALFGPSHDSHNQRDYLADHVLRDRDPDGCPHTSLEEKWATDGAFSEITTHLSDLENQGARLHTTAAFRVIEVGARVLDSRFGPIAAGVVFGGLAMADRIRRVMNRTPEFGSENITSPITPDEIAPRYDLSRYVQRARYLQTTAVSESGQPDMEHIRANTLASSLLCAVGTIVSESTDPTSFNTALDIAVARYTQTVDKFRTPEVISLARSMVAQRFDQVGVEASLAQVPPQVA